ncbi:hypothetical protein LIER_06578 [Lithospermum erythrorhizon]|uniref:Uncharacterized protein n=1 Tax=Lithospermum erythrorhizon TaxID=34254 RepID=A0AAV3P6R8_LITER
MPWRLRVSGRWGGESDEMGADRAGSSEEEMELAGLWAGWSEVGVCGLWWRGREGNIDIQRHVSGRRGQQTRTKGRWAKSNRTGLVNESDQTRSYWASGFCFCWTCGQADFTVDPVWSSFRAERHVVDGAQVWVDGPYEEVAQIWADGPYGMFV